MDGDVQVSGELRSEDFREKARDLRFLALMATEKAEFYERHAWGQELVERGISFEWYP